MDSDDRNPDGALNVRFHTISVYQTYDSLNALLPDGKPNPRYTGTPVYRDVSYIEITTPGGLNRVFEEVRADHKARFPKQWAMFEMSQGGGDQVVGMKLSEWPSISRSRAEELRAMKFYVVEQIAEASDQQVQAIGMDGITLRQRARQFLKLAKDTALADRQSAELAQKQKEIDALKDADAAKEERLARLEAMLESGPVAQAPKRKGRPPKVQQVEQIEA